VNVVELLRVGDLERKERKRKRKKKKNLFLTFHRLLKTREEEKTLAVSTFFDLFPP
jgi:hypothetical protein